MKAARETILLALTQLTYSEDMSWLTAFKTVRTTLVVLHVFSSVLGWVINYIVNLSIAELFSLLILNFHYYEGEPLKVLKAFK